LGAPNYNLTNTNNGATVGFRRDSTSCFSDSPNADSSDDHQSPPSGHAVGPQRVRSRNERKGHEPYSTSLHARSNHGNRSAAWNDTSTVNANYNPFETMNSRLTVAQQRSNLTIGSNVQCSDFTSSGIFKLAPAVLLFFLSTDLIPSQANAPASGVPMCTMSAS
jgi:hypothetical protein